MKLFFYLRLWLPYADPDLQPSLALLLRLSGSRAASFSPVMHDPEDPTMMIYLNFGTAGLMI